MARAGWLKIHRQILDWEWYHDANTFRVFFHLLMLANYGENEYQGVDLGRGQCIVKVSELAKTLRQTIRQTRTALDHLKSTNEIAIKTTNKYSIVTIVKYEEYQGLQLVGEPVDNLVNDKRDGKQDDIQTTNKTLKNDKQNDKPTLYTKNNNKEYLSKNNKNSACAREESDGSTKKKGTALEIEEYIAAREAEGKKVSRAMMEILRYREMNDG